MSVPSRIRQAPGTNIHEMMERLRIDVACAVMPRFALTFSSGISICRTCAVSETCSSWLAGAPSILSAPPGFCPGNAPLVELLREPATRRGAPAPL